MVLTCPKCSCDYKRQFENNHDCVLYLKTQISDLTLVMKTMMKEMIEIKKQNAELRENMGRGTYENIFLCF